MQHSFLKSIARGFLDAHRGALYDYVFVFPNPRSARFFKSLLDEGAAQWCMPFHQLVEEASGRTRTDRAELVMMLYKAYLRVMEGRDNVMDFNRFRYWGEMMLNDFDQIDSALVDTAELFHNIEDFKEIQTDYLTDEQRRAIEGYWHIERPANPEERENLVKRFWAHVGQGAKGRKRSFPRLWQIMGETYAEFQRMLAETGQGYRGLAERLTAEKSAGEKPLLPSRSRAKFVFIGFNRLTPAQHLIFSRLRDKGKAYFYWDYDPTLMDPSRGNKAGLYLAGYVKEFAATHPSVPQPDCRSGRHEVTVVSVASGVGQAKVAARYLTADSSLVLPDEEMLLPMVSSIPDDLEIPKVNVTMGYPLRFSAVSQLFGTLVAMQLRSTEAPGSGREFFRDDVMALLTLPFIRSAMPEACRRLPEFMSECHTFNLLSDAILSTDDETLRPLKPLFEPLMDQPDDVRAASDYVCRMLDLAAEQNLGGEVEAKAFATLQKRVSSIAGLIEKYGVEMNVETYFQLLERAVFQGTLPLRETDFDAMQVMGLKETRCMGFDNVVMLSMNDDILPGRMFRQSFVPDALRRAFGLPTIADTEADAAYYFYHLLSRSRKLTLIYDSRTSIIKSGQMSRFILQLLYCGFPSVDVTLYNASFAQNLTANRFPAFPVLIERFDLVRDGLLRYTLAPDHDDRKLLSASACKDYLVCPKKFCLRRALDIQLEDPDKSEMSAVVRGNIVHQTAEKLFLELAGRNEGKISRAELFDVAASDPDRLLESELRHAINVHLFGFEEDSPEAYSTPIGPKGELYYVTVRDPMLAILTREADDFRLLGTEVNMQASWPLAEDGREVQFVMKIDRLDQLEDGTVRLIDYKTGRDHLDAKSMDDVFSGDKNAIFQLLAYCALYHRATGTPRALLRPQIYKVNSRVDGAFEYITVGGTPLLSYEQVAGEFEERFTGILADMFCGEGPFVTPDGAPCEYCDYNSMCNLEPKTSNRRR